MGGPIVEIALEQRPRDGALPFDQHPTFDLVKELRYRAAQAAGSH